MLSMLKDKLTQNSIADIAVMTFYNFARSSIEYLGTSNDLYLQHLGLERALAFL